MKKILFVFALCLGFAALSNAQAALSGKWAVKMDNDGDAGPHAGKDIGTIEFKHDAATNKYYFVGSAVRNGYVASCATCAGAEKDKSVVGTKWGDGFTYNAAASRFEGGTVTEPSSGKKGSSMSIRVIDATHMELSGKSPSGKSRTVTLTKE
jgi:hypothetical protein